MRVAVVGVGLVGGSVALAARRSGHVVVGYDPAPGEREVCAMRDTLAAAVREAEAVVVATPIAAVREQIAAVLEAAGPDAAVTDVASVKRPIAVEDPRFVGGHPLAGAETAGVEHAREDLFDGATWYLTPAPTTRGVLYDRVHRLIRDLGARPQPIDAETHDRVMAAVSHLPHVLANILASTAANALGGERLPATGPSFRDATRVAGAPTDLWTDIYTANADALAATIDVAIEELRRFKALSRDELAAWNDAAREDRRRLESQLAGATVTELRVAVPNRPGVVAEIALALTSINIVDMALYPAPDDSTGVVAVWVAGDPASAEALLAGLGHPVARA